MSGNIIIKGWLKNGRPIEVELPSSGNRQTDIAGLYRDWETACVVFFSSILL